MFFDCPSPSQVSVNEEEEASISYLIFEPVVEEETNIEDTDWRRYDPPIELLRSQDGLSNDLEQILAPSIERIKARHLEEEQRRAAASRIERPLARAGRASVKPRRQASGLHCNKSPYTNVCSDLNDWCLKHHSPNTTRTSKRRQRDIFILQRLRIRITITRNRAISESKIGYAKVNI
jgi:hypothetical protein